MIEKNGFLQSASLVILGATISFFSSLGTGYFSAKNEASQSFKREKTVFETNLLNDVMNYVRSLEYDIDSLHNWNFVSQDNRDKFAARSSIVNLNWRLMSIGYYSKMKVDFGDSATSQFNQLNQQFIAFKMDMLDILRSYDFMNKPRTDDDFKNQGDSCEDILQKKIFQLQDFLTRLNFQLDKE